MNFEKDDFKWGAKVADFMMSMHRVDAKRYEAATGYNIPYGDLAYGAALAHWHKNGCKIDAWFSYAEGERACPLLMEFRKEITAKFKLPILTAEEAKLRAKTTSLPVRTHKVHDWGLN